MSLRFLQCALLVTVAFPFSLGAQNIAVVAEHLYTMDAGPQGGPGMVLIRDGKIEETRQGANMQPPDGFQVIHGAYVTPGLVDADTTAGVAGAYNIPADQDQDEATDPNTAMRRDGVCVAASVIWLLSIARGESLERWSENTEGRRRVVEFFIHARIWRSCARSGFARGLTASWAAARETRWRASASP